MGMRATGVSYQLTRNLEGYKMGFACRMKMRMRATALVLFLWALAGLGGQQSGEVDDPVLDHARRIGQYDKPEDPSNAELLQTVHLVRFRADFNADGLDDVAVSDTMGWMKNEGGDWWLYLRNENGRYTLFKQPLHFHPLAIHVEPRQKGQARITCYHRIDGEHGVLVVRTLSGSEWTELSRKTMRPKGNPADKREYESLFGRLYRHPVSEFCVLGDYLNDKNCSWEKGY